MSSRLTFYSKLITVFINPGSGQVGEVVNHVGYRIAPYSRLVRLLINTDIWKDTLVIQYLLRRRLYKLNDKLSVTSICIRIQISTEIGLV